MANEMSKPLPAGNLLTEDDRNRIRAEEIFRAELREEFAKPKPSRWWTFLNSSFGLWFLGSVTLAGITWLYNNAVSARHASTELAEVKTALGEELEMRLAMASYSIQIDASAGRDSKLSLKELNELVLNEVNGSREVLHPEFRGVPANALFWRLIHLSGKPKGYVNGGENNWQYLEPKLRMGDSSAQEIKRRLEDISKGLGDLYEHPR